MVLYKGELMPDHFYRYFKLITENNIISKNKWLIMLLFFGTSATGNITQVFSMASKSNQLTATQNQVSKLADLYHKHYTEDCK